jgi:microcystin degradation protein MlrC
MIATLHTTREPAPSFTDRASALEGKDGIVSISIVHGFAWGDTPEALDAALAGNGTVVLGDGSDNPGGGAPGDSTFILRRILERRIGGVCLEMAVSG